MILQVQDIFVFSNVIFMEDFLCTHIGIVVC